MAGGKRLKPKPPLINRGYYARTATIYAFAKKFLAAFSDSTRTTRTTYDEKVSLPQIVSLGAGHDTLFWRLRRDGFRETRIFELDMPSVVSKKQAAISRSVLLEAELEKDYYRLIAGDLADAEGVVRLLSENGVDFDLPTLFIAECVLVYLPNEKSAALFSALAAKFNAAIFVNYEMINPHDRFGQVMVRNLEARGCPLLGLKDCPTLETQRKRFTDNGWQLSEAIDMNAVYARLDTTDRMRTERLEIFDELEEWELMSAHYCISWASIERAGPGPLAGISI